MMLDTNIATGPAGLAYSTADGIRRLAEDWRHAGIDDGDVVLIHSSLKRTLRRLLKQKLRVGPADVVESFRQATGPDGTILFPLFSWDFPKGIPFDVRSSPSQMGSLTEAARLYRGSVRTGHPIYSFAVIGAQSALFRGLMNFSGYGADSCFAKLREMGGKIAVLDLPDQNSMTFYHHVEETISALKEARVLNGNSSYFLGFDHHETSKEALGYLVPNHNIRKACYESVKDFKNIDLITSSEVTSVETNSYGASVQLSNGQNLAAKLVIAADSRFSTIRRKMGISTAMKDFGRVVIVCQMEHEALHDNIAYECFHYDQTLAVLPLYGNKSSVVITLPAHKSEAVLAMDEKTFNADIEQRFGHRLGKMKLVGERYPYPLVGTYAKEFISTRFALLGDAAVGMHPVTAHGYNLGLKGAHTLATSILGALNTQNDIGAASVLESYQSQHRRIAKPLYLGTNALVKLYTSEDFGSKIARDVMLRLANHLPLVKRVIMDQLTDSSSLWNLTGQDTQAKSTHL